MGNHTSVRSRTSAPSHAVVARAFARASTRLTPLGEVDSKPVYGVTLGRTAWVAKLVPMAEAAREEAAHEIAKMVGLDASQPRLDVVTRQGKTYVLTARVAGETLAAITNQQSWESMRAALHAQPTRTLTRLMLFDYLIGDRDRGGAQFMLDRSTGRLSQLDHAAAFDYWVGFNGRHALLPGLGGRPDTGGASWRQTPISHSDLHAMLNHARAIEATIDLFVHDPGGGHSYYFSRRVNVLRELAAMDHPTMGDWARLAPAD